MPTFPSGTTPFREMVRSYFEQRPNQWIDAETLQGVGGRHAWRTRVSECRRQHGMVIENRVRREKNLFDNEYIISEYRYVPPSPTSADVEWAAHVDGEDRYL